MSFITEMNKHLNEGSEDIGEGIIPKRFKKEKFKKVDSTVLWDWALSVGASIDTPVKIISTQNNEFGRQATVQVGTSRETYHIYSSTIGLENDEIKLTDVTAHTVNGVPAYAFKVFK